MTDNKTSSICRRIPGGVIACTAYLKEDDRIKFILKQLFGDKNWEHMPIPKYCPFCGVLMKGKANE